MRRRRKSGLNPIGGCILIIAGLMMMGGVYFVHLKQLEFASIAQTTTGTVIELVRGTGKSKTYAPVVQFLTPREHVYTFKSSISSNPPAYQVGDQVEILYNPEAPEQAVIAKDNSITTNPIMWVFGAVGVGLFMVGVYPIAKMFRWLRLKLLSRPQPESLQPYDPPTTAA